MLTSAAEWREPASTLSSFLSVLTHRAPLRPQSLLAAPSASCAMASSSTAVNYPVSQNDGLDDVSTSSSDLILGSFDPSKLHPLAGIEDKLDYLLLEDDKVSDLPGAGTAIPSRGWSDDLSYGTGTMYLSGSYLTPFSTYHVVLMPRRS